MILFYVILIVSILVYVYYTRTFNYWKLRKVPFLKPIFPFGSLTDVFLKRAHPGKLIGDFYYKIDGPYFGFYAFNRPYLVARDPEFIKTILIRDFKYFSNRYFISDQNIDFVNSSGLFAIKNPKWKYLRLKNESIFSLSKLRIMIPLIKETNKSMMNYISENVGKSVEVKEICAKYTTDAITNCFFGLSVNSFEKESGFRLAGKRILSQSLPRKLSVLCYYYAPELVKMFKFKFIAPSAVEFLQNAFVDAINIREASKQKRNDFIDILIKLKSETDNNEITFDTKNLIAQAITFFSSGYESSASTLAFTLHELAVHTDIQMRLRGELQRAVQKYGKSVYNTLNELTYLDMVVSESLRKYPTTSFIHRECVEDYTVAETGLIIEKGTPIVIAQYGLHYDDNYFPNPEIYDPERFSKSNVDKIASCQMFGLLMVKMGLFEILTNFEIKTNANTKEPVVLSPFPIIQAEGGLNLTFYNLKDS